MGEDPTPSEAASPEPSPPDGGEGVRSTPPGRRSLKRDPALIPLSRDHHFALMHALALTRSTGASPERRGAVAEAFLAYYDEEMLGHMADEEEALLPRGAAADPEGAQRLLREHEELRSRAEALRRAAPDRGELLPLLEDLGQRLHDHVRFEERELFEAMQERLPADVLDAIGRMILEHREARGVRPGCRLPAR